MAPLLTYPLRAFLDLSTAHLTPKTREWLDSLEWGRVGGNSLCGGATAHGWFLWVPEDNESGCGGPFPADLWACFEKARALKAEYVMFDADASPGAAALDDLPIYAEDNDTDFVTAAGL